MRRQESHEISLTYSSRPTEQGEQQRRQRGEWTKEQRAEQGHPGEAAKMDEPSPQRRTGTGHPKQNHILEQSPGAQTKLSDSD